MTIYTSAMIANQIYSANQQMLGGPPSMAAPMPIPGMWNNVYRGGAGMYGERAAAMMGSVGQAGVGFGRLGAELALGGFGSSVGMTAASALGYGTMGTIGMGLAASAAFTMPAIAVGSVFRAYGGAFQGGMEDQAALNSTLRNNFNFFGGSGPMGRGFNQAQMGQIGNVLGGELRRNPFASSGELNQLIAGGVDSGMFTGTRDVQQFTQNFRRMLDTLRNVQRELGGTLTEALSFVRSSQQAGIFQNADRVNFAAEIRSAEAVTGMDRTQLVALAATGAHISRSYGGYGRQGAYGALRGAQTLGAALSSGSVDAETLSEATGGLTGADAINAFTTSTLARAGRFSRTGAGRFSLFAMSNADGTGLDSDMLRRMQTGDISVGDIMRRAHENVGRMGRARALNREGALRGELMEEGGMSAQIGIMRLLLGDRVMDRGDDFAQIVMQRRFGMSRPESEIWGSLIRNQGRIAERESIDRISSRREADFNTDMRENRSLDAFMTRFEHGVSEATGLTRAREMGRDFVSRISGIAERTMNSILGTASGTGLSTGDNAALSRISIGRGTSADLDLVAGAGRGMGTVTAGSLFANSLANDALNAMGMHGGDSIGRVLERRGVRGLRGRDAGINARIAIDEARLAAGGVVTGASRDALSALEGDRDSSIRRISESRLMAQALGDPNAFYEAMGGDANAVDAFLAREGLAGTGLTPGRGALMGLGGLGVRGTLGAMAGATRSSVSRGPRGMMTRLFGSTGAMMAGVGGALGVLGDLASTPEDNALSFVARGGHLAAASERLSPDAIASSLSMLESPEARRNFLGRAEVRSALLGRGAANVSEDTLRSVTSTDDFRRRLSRITGAGSSEAAMREVAALRRAGEGMTDGASRSAMASIASQMEYNLQNMGDIGDEYRRLGRNPVRDAAIMDALNDARASAATMGRSLEGVAGTDTLRAALSRAAAGESGLDINAGMNSALESLIGMDPDSDAYREVSRALGGGETAGALLTAASESRRRRRDLTGGGRGGMRRAGETAMGMLTGGRFSEMDIGIGTGARRRRIRSASDAFSILRRGGEGAADISRGLEAGLSEMGVTNASDIMARFNRLAEGGFTGDEARKFDRFITNEMSSGSLGEASNRANEEALRRANPLDAQRNDLLTQIRDGVRSMGRSGDQGVDRPTD